ncbi:MAG: hypothetical protein JWL71_1394 [Acidobacteria bacterium]|nr:hypothetical protein [Acidobacteriota bacterium]
MRILAQATSPACAPLGCFAPGTESEIWQSMPPFGIPDDPSCLNGDPRSELELPRSCGGAPPPLGQFLYPYAVAVDGATIYVSDQFNHRIQAFKSDGSPQAIANLIGNGTPGDAAGQLNAPEGIAVDAAHNILVADSYNSRIAVFHADGTPAPSGHLPVVDTVSTTFARTTPTGIALSPGTTVLGYHVPVPTGDEHRIVVTDRDTCFVYIYDAGFNLKAQIPPTLPSAPSQGACVGGADPSHPPVPGVFSSPSGAAIDASGHIFVTDYDNSRVQIFDRDGRSLGTFGTPPDPSSLPVNGVPPPSSLQFPWAVVVDHTGRVVVTDTENQRIAFFNVDFASTPPSATYLFQLNAGGTLNGFPTGIAEQTDPDPAGRILVTDTANHRVQWFQLPDLAIVLPKVDAAASSGTFGVVVPSEKLAAAVDVQTFVTPTNADIVTGPTAQPPANAAAQVDIAPGQIVTYSFTYAPRRPGPVSFVVSASANNGITAASPVDAAASVVCHTGCHASAAIYRAPLSTPPLPAIATANWYNTPVVVRITADSTTPGVGLSKIAYQFTSGPEAAIHGGTVHLVDASAVTGSVDVSITQERTSVLTFWAVYDDGSQVAPQQLPVSLDLTPPSITFNPPPAAGVDAAGQPWYNGPVVVPYVIGDGLSGTATQTGSMSFSLEQRNQKQSVVATDLAGNTVALASDVREFGGRAVNIDTRAPTFSALPAAITIELTGPGAGVMTAAQALLFKATATDPPLADGTAGSGVVMITNPVAGVTSFPMSGAGPTASAHTFTARDAAGNTVNQNVSVTVRDTTAPVFNVCPATLALNVSGPAATLALPSLSGSVSATDLSGTVTLSQSVAAGTRLGLGVRAVNVIATDPSGNANICTVNVTVADATSPTVLNQPPAITAGNVTAVATSPSGAAVSFTPVITDASDPHPVLSCTRPSGSTFPIGTTSVTCTATNRFGLDAAATFTVTVNHSAPVCTTAVASPGALWPPNHTLVPISIDGLTTADGGAITTTITSIFQDEPASGRSGGNTAIDGYGVGTSQARVRSERSDTGNGRVYDIAYNATTRGGSCTATVTVGVPRDEAHPAIRDGVRYDSTKE